MNNRGELNPPVIIAAVVLMIILLFGAYFKLNYDYEKTTFKLNGESEITKEIGTEFKDPGYIAIVNKKDRESLVTVESNVNTKQLGTYQIKYILKYKMLNKEKVLYRKINIVDTTKPVLKINSKEKIYLTEGEKYTYPTYKATDNVDGNITEKVKVNSNLNTKKAGTYQIKYSVKDSSNNSVTKKITIYVKAKPEPVKIITPPKDAPKTFIIVSISQQALNYYKDGILKLSSPVVTGIYNGTPLGSYRVQSKARNVTLRGKDYESYVYYWIAFIGGEYGIHDATWRDSFGGDIYKTNGSHGCVNMPYYKAQQLYNMVSIGTPVYINK